MTLKDANQTLTETDCCDAEAVTAALTERARAIVEFAALAPKELLLETHEAGEAFRDRLELAKIEAHRELDRMTKLSRGLESTLDQPQTLHFTCFG
jgi:hypothetical protein